MRLDIRRTDLARFLAGQAKARECSPAQVALSLLHCIARDEMADAVLDGEDPRLLFPPAAPSENALPSMQDRALRAIAHRQVTGGECVATISDVAASLGRQRGQARNTIKALVRRGYLIRTAVGSPYTPSRYRLTDQARQTLTERTS